MEKTEVNIVILTGSDQAVLSTIANHLQSSLRLKHIRFMDLVRKEVAEAWQFDVELFSSKVFQETKDLRYSVAACNYDPFTNHYIDTHPYEHSTTVQRSPAEIVMMWFKYRLELDALYWFRAFDQLVIKECTPLFSGEGDFQHNGFVLTEITCEAEANFIAELPHRAMQSNVAFKKVETIAVYQNGEEPRTGPNHNVAIAHDVETDRFCYGIIHDVSEHVVKYMFPAKVITDSAPCNKPVWGPYYNGHALAHGLVGFIAKHGQAYYDRIAEMYSVESFNEITDQKLIAAITATMNDCEVSGKIMRKHLP